MSGQSSYAVLSEEEASDTIYQISRFKVAELKDLARSLGLRLTGKKQDIVDRIVQFFEYGRHYSDNLRLLTVRTLVLKKSNHDSLPPFQVLYNSIRSGAYSFTDVANQYNGGNVSRTQGHSDSMAFMEHSLYFRSSPFYKPVRLVHGSPQVALPTRSRAVCDYNFVLNSEENTYLSMTDDNYRFYLLCGVQSNKSPSTIDALIDFPSPVEIHINGRILQENVKGIKGKPGTAKPADVTKYINPFPRANKMQMVYSVTEETYLLYLYIVKVTPCSKLIQEIVQKSHIHKSATIYAIKNNSSNDDDDDDDIIVSTSSVTLKDPISYTRMKYPVQSIYCTHIECFDGLIFLESQLQLPTWSCPNCHKPVRIEDIAISDYFLEVLSKVPESTEHILINEDGSWELEAPKSSPPRSKSSQPFSEEISIEPDRPPKVEEIEIVSIDSDSGSDTEVEPISVNRQSMPQNNVSNHPHSQPYRNPEGSLHMHNFENSHAVSSFRSQDDSIPLSRLDPNFGQRPEDLHSIHNPQSFQNEVPFEVIDAASPQETAGSTLNKHSNNWSDGQNSISNNNASGTSDNRQKDQPVSSALNDYEDDYDNYDDDDDDDDDSPLPVVRTRRTRPPTILETVDTFENSSASTNGNSGQSAPASKEADSTSNYSSNRPAFDIGGTVQEAQDDRNTTSAENVSNNFASNWTNTISNDISNSSQDIESPLLNLSPPNNISNSSAPATENYPQYLREALDYQERQQTQRRQQHERHEHMRSQLLENLNQQRTSSEGDQPSYETPDPNRHRSIVDGQLLTLELSQPDDSAKENDRIAVEVNEPPNKQQKVSSRNGNVLVNHNFSDINRQLQLEAENSHSNLSPLNGKITDLMIETPTSNRIANQADESTPTINDNTQN